MRRGGTLNPTMAIDGELRTLFITSNMGTYVVCNLRVPIFVAVESFAIVLCLQLSNLRYNRD